MITPCFFMYVKHIYVPLDLSLNLATDTLDHSKDVRAQRFNYKAVHFVPLRFDIEVLNVCKLV